MRLEESYIENLHRFFNQGNGFVAM